MKRIRAFNQIIRFIRKHRNTHGIGGFKILTTGNEIIITTNPMPHHLQVKETLRVKWYLNKN